MSTRQQLSSYFGSKKQRKDVRPKLTDAKAFMISIGKLIKSVRSSIMGSPQEQGRPAKTAKTNLAGHPD